jgi:hypothetical protein
MSTALPYIQPRNHLYSTCIPFHCLRRRDLIVMQFYGEIFSELYVSLASESTIIFCLGMDSRHCTHIGSATAIVESEVAYILYLPAN